MFAATFLLLAALVTASPLKRSPGLVISLSTVESSINSIEDISLVATVENTVISRFLSLINRTHVIIE